MCINTMSRLVVLVAILASWPLQAIAQSNTPSKYTEIAATARAAAGWHRGARLCSLSAFLSDRNSAGTNLRAGPSASARIVKRIPNARDEAGERIAPEFDVIGSAGSWLLVRDIRWAGYDLDPELIERGPVWIASALAGVTIEGLELLREPHPGSPIVAPLRGLRPDGSLWTSGDTRLVRIHGCSGSMLEVSIEFPTGGQARGWANGACANQVTTCGGGFLRIIESGGALIEYEGP